MAYIRSSRDCGLPARTFPASVAACAKKKRGKLSNNNLERAYSQQRPGQSAVIIFPNTGFNRDWDLPSVGSSC